MSMQIKTDYVVTQDGRNLIKETDWRWILSNISSEVNVSSMSLSRAMIYDLGANQIHIWFIQTSRATSEVGKACPICYQWHVPCNRAETWTRKGNRPEFPLHSAIL